MASIRKLKNGKYQATIFIGRDANGKQLRKYVTRDTYKECKAAAREIEQEIEEGRFIDVKNIRLSVWMDKWLALNKERLAPSTYLSYKMYVDVHFKPTLGKLKLNQINEIHIQEYMNNKLKELSPTTVRKHMFVLRKILDDALKHKNPARNIKIPAQSEYMPHVPTSEEFEMIHQAVKGTRDEIIVLLAGWCGLRRGEIFALKWNDINWKEGTIRIDESRSISEDGFLDKQPKSKNGLREIVVPEYLMNLLEQYRRKQKQITERIFPIRPDYYSSYFAELIKKKGLPNIRFHDLRHYHATWLYEQGVPDQYAAQRLGHDIHVLKSIYQHLQVDKKKEIDESIRKLTITQNRTNNRTNF
nr:MAG: site-specific integrase [Caldicoprobacter oshimai]